MYCLGVSNQSPDQVLLFLKKKGEIKEFSDVAIVPVGTKLKADKKPSRKILFIVSVSDLYRNLEVLNSARYKGRQVFVFASPLRLVELENTAFLDFERSTVNSGLGYILKNKIDLQRYKVALKEESGPVSRKDTKYLTSLIDTVKKGSLLTPLMTYIYTLPSSTHQTPVKEAVASYLYKGLSWTKLESTLDSIKGVAVSQRTKDKLKEILRTEIGENYRQAFALYRETKEGGKTPSLASICKKFETSDYEMRYIKSIIEDRDEKKPSRGKSLASLVRGVTKVPDKKKRDSTGTTKKGAW